MVQEPSYLTALLIWLAGFGAFFGVLGGPALGVEAMLYFFPRYNVHAVRKETDRDSEEAAHVAIVIEEEEEDNNTPGAMLQLMNTTMRALSALYVVHFVHCTLMCGAMLVCFCGLFFMVTPVTPAAAIGRSVFLMYALMYWARLEAISRGCREFIGVSKGFKAALMRERPELILHSAETATKPQDGA